MGRPQFQELDMQAKSPNIDAGAMHPSPEADGGDFRIFILPSSSAGMNGEPGKRKCWHPFTHAPMGTGKGQSPEAPRLLLLRCLGKMGNKMKSWYRCDGFCGGNSSQQQSGGLEKLDRLKEERKAGACSHLRMLVAEREYLQVKLSKLWKSNPFPSLSVPEIRMKQKIADEKTNYCKA